MLTPDIKWRSSLERYFQGISAESWQLPGIRHRLCQGWAGTAWGWELRELRMVAGCLHGRGCCQPTLRLLFRIDQDWQWRWQK